MRRLFFISFLLLPLPAAAQDVVWHINPGRSLAFIRPACSEEELLRDYGNWNVARTTLSVDGASVPVTLLFPHDDAKRIALLWHDDSERRQLKLAILRGTGSFWRLPGNVTLGTPYRKLAEINARPVGVTALETEPGTLQVSDWQNGQYTRFAPYLDVRLSSRLPATAGRVRPLADNAVSEIRLFFPEPK